MDEGVASIFLLTLMRVSVAEVVKALGAKSFPRSFRCPPAIVGVWPRKVLALHKVPRWPSGLLLPHQEGDGSLSVPRVITNWALKDLAWLKLEVKPGLSVFISSQPTHDWEGDPKVVAPFEPRRTVDIASFKSTIRHASYTTLDITSINMYIYIWGFP